jgi:Replication-relaxation
MTQTKFRIMPIYDILLCGSPDIPMGLFQLHTATAEQLCRLHYKPGCIKAIKARLKDLAEHGYVQYDVIPGREFRRPYYYTLGTKGARYLQQAGLDTNDAFRASKEVNKHALFVEHALELNDIIIAAALLKSVGTGFYLHTFVHERTLRRRPYKASWRVNGRQEAMSLIPDALLDFRYSDGQKQLRIPVLLEHDRGTEQQQHFRQRIRAYITFLKEKAQQHYFNASVVTIAFTTFAGTGRLEQMRHWAKQELTGANAAFSQAFVFAHLARPLEPCSLWLEPCWHTLYMEGKQIALLTEEQ